MIEKGEADVILAFEQLEAARWLPYLRKGGQIVVNTQKTDPMPVITGAATYPEGILEAMQEAGVSLTPVDALSLAEAAGSAKAVNVVLLGVMARHLDISREQWETAIRETVPPKFIDMNLKAFALGYEQA